MIQYYITLPEENNNLRSGRRPANPKSIDV
jgi:hypothetical protein